jgi:NAD(P)-dependent dehydrogenase (short-subunit alcohol dehydrogenase family)
MSLNARQTAVRHLDRAEKAMLEGRRILITGGSSGIGAATMAVARGRGAQSHNLDLNKPLEAEQGSFSQVDITDFAEVERAVAEAAERMGGIDGLANVAGLGAGGLLEDTDMAVWDRVFAVNVTGTLNVTRAALPFLRNAEEASIVNVSSGQGLRPFPGTGAYAASKRAVLSLTQTWAQELAPRIRVNAVCPGAVETPMLTGGDQSADSQARRPAADLYALKRIAQPQEIATAIAFLLGSDASFVTGVILPVDGGRAYH